MFEVFVGAAETNGVDKRNNSSNKSIFLAIDYPPFLICFSSRVVCMQEGVLEFSGRRRTKWNQKRSQGHSSASRKKLTDTHPVFHLFF